MAHPRIVFDKTKQTYIVTYEPLPRQKVLHGTKAAQILYGGAAGGGKSVSLRWDAHMFCLSSPGLRAYLFRRNRTELQRNHIDFIKDEIPADLATYNKQQNVLEFVNGSKLYMCFCDNEDDVRLYQGAEIHWLGIDEATHLSAFQINYLRTRVRLGSFSPAKRDKDYLPRIILSTNPHGGPGHSFIKSTFVDPAESEEIFPDATTSIEEKKDAKGNVIKKSYPGMKTIFIPARMMDNPYLDDSYEGQFSGLPPELIKALKEGDWSSVLGAALPNLSERTHKIPSLLSLRNEGKLQFNHWMKFMSMDWGTARPFSVLWFAVADQWLEIYDSKDNRTINVPEGALIIFAEDYGCVTGQENKGLRLPSEAVARRILDKEKDMNISVEYRVADSQMWAQSDGPSPQEKMMKHGVLLRQAKKERKINYEEILSRLSGNPDFKKTGEVQHPMLYICENVHSFWRTVPGLVLDENDPDNGPATIKPKQEDHCFAADTLVSTPYGDMKIAEMSEEGLVNTPDGVKPYYGCRKRIDNSEVIKLTFSDNSEVICTPDHKFLDSYDAWAYAKYLLGKEVKCIPQSSVKQFKNSMGKSITSAESISRRKVKDYIWQSGNTIMEKYRKSTISIIRTIIDLIIPQRTLNALAVMNIAGYTPIIQMIWNESENTCEPLCSPRQQNGIVRWKGLSGIKSILKNTQERYGKKVRKKDSVIIAEKTIQHIKRKLIDFVLMLVAPRTDGNQGWMILQKFAGAVQNILKQTNTDQENSVQKNVVLKCVSIEPAGYEDTYCLTVPDTHRFLLANGAVVHNCYDSVAYGCRSRPFVINLEDRYNMDMDSYKEQYMRAREEIGASCVDPYHCG